MPFFRGILRGHEKNVAYEFGLSSFLGILWAMTPLMGIQFPIVLLNWFLFRLIGIHFHLLLAISFLWITNPLTIAPLYLTFFLCGSWFLSLVNYPVPAAHQDLFERAFTFSSETGLWDGVVIWVQSLVFHLGLPMFLGGFIIGYPLAVGGYFGTIYIVKRIQIKKAKVAKMKERKNEESIE